MEKHPLTSATKKRDWEKVWNTHKITSLLGSIYNEVEGLRSATLFKKD